MKRLVGNFSQPVNNSEKFVVLASVFFVAMLSQHRTKLAKLTTMWKKLPIPIFNKFHDLRGDHPHNIDTMALFWPLLETGN